MLETQTASGMREITDQNPDIWISEVDGYCLVDEDNHIWLVVGTGDHDDWYPFFVCDYHPKEPKQ